MTQSATSPWFEKAAKPIQRQHHDAAQAHQAMLTKLLGSLGRLEDVAVAFCAWQETNSPIPQPNRHIRWR